MMNQTIELTHETNSISIKKKKGRPRKIPIIECNNDIVTNQETQPEKKKRGRKKKEKLEEEVKQKKKRGRKAALKFFSSTIRKKIPLTAVIYDNDKSILHLDIKEDEDVNKKNINYDALKDQYNEEQTILGTNISIIDDAKISTNVYDDYDNDDILCEYIDNDEMIDISELYEKRLESRLKQDNQLIKNLENLHNNDTLLTKLLHNVNEKVNNFHDTPHKTISSQKKDIIDNRKKGIFMLLSEYIDTSTWIDKTDVCCWWCCHTFETIPIGLPVDYNVKLKKFRVRGIFCSFACMLAYNPTVDNKINAMITHLYRQLTGAYAIDKKNKYIDMLQKDSHIQQLFTDVSEYKDEYITSLTSFIEEPLEKAPSRYTLKMFGGDLTIEEFRNATKERKIYKMVEYPMYISRDYVEEVDLQNLKNINKNLFNKQHTTFTNSLDDKQLEEVKNRVKSSVIVTNNSIDKFITF